MTPNNNNKPTLPLLNKATIELFEQDTDNDKPQTTVNLSDVDLSTVEAISAALLESTWCWSCEGRIEVTFEASHY